MSWDVLLHWMSHLGGGSWEGFKRAVVRLAGEDADLDDVIVALRFHLSDLGYVDFFTDGSRRWQVLPPTLVGLVPAGTAILTGGRTPRLQEVLFASAERFGCVVSTESIGRGPATLRLQGTREGFAHVAAEIGVRFSARHAFTLAAQLTPLFKKFEEMTDETAPTNWSVRSFDFHSMAMSEGLRRNSACEYSPRYGVSRWYVHTRQGRLRSLPKREAIFVAAMLQGVKLLSFDAERSSLLALTNTPPPESYARVACLCSGQRPAVNGERLTFPDVPATIAGVLCVAAGQPPPLMQAGAQVFTTA